MKTKTFTLIALLFTALTSCEKEAILMKRDAGLAVRSEQPPTAKYEFYAAESVPCNTFITSGQWKPFYSSCNNSPSDNSITQLKVWYREYKWTSCVNGQPVSPGLNWVLVTNSCGVNGKSKWVKQPAVTPGSGEVWNSICTSGVPVNPNNDPNYTGAPSNSWELIYSNCSTGNALFWMYQ